MNQKIANTKATLVAFFWFTSVALCQNLIPNASFEDYSTCPTELRQFNYAVGWDKANAGSPELFNSCGITKNFEANTGNGFAGVILLTTYEDVVEYLQVKLNDSLQANQNYCLSYYIRLSDDSPIAINKIGAHFSKARLFKPYWTAFRKNPQVVNNSIVTNINEWQKVSNTFTAKGGEQYLTFGNFFKRYLIEEQDMKVANTDFSSYYFLDDVELYAVETNCNSIKRPQVPKKEKIIKKTHIVYFDLDSFLISPKEMNLLTDFLTNLPKPLLQVVKVEGHTDLDATFEYNYALSQKRAEVVKSELLKFGLNNVFATWFGEEKPTNKELNKSEKAKNRRVEISIE